MKHYMLFGTYGGIIFLLGGKHA